MAMSALRAGKESFLDSGTSHCDNFSFDAVNHTSETACAWPGAGFYSVPLEPSAAA